MDRTMPAEAGAGGTQRGRLAELYVRHAAQGTRLAYVLTGDLDLAQDIVQDAFVKVARRLVHLREPSAFHAYFRRTIINLVNSHYRRKRVERMFLRRQSEAIAGLSAQTNDLGEREDLRRALLQLPPRQRAALALRFLEDLSERDTADVLGCRPGTVKALVSKGLQRLRQTAKDW